MKKLILFLVVILSVQGVKAGEQDTLWTKRIGTVRSVKFAPDGSKVAAGTENGDIFIYDTQTGEELRHYSHYTGGFLDFSQDGRYLCTLGSNYKDSLNDIIRIWDLDSIKSFTVIKDTIKPVYSNSKTGASIAFSHDGKYLAISYYLGSDNHALIVFDWISRKPSYFQRTSNDNSYHNLHFSSDNKYLAATQYINNSKSIVNVFDVNNWNVVRTFDPLTPIFDLKFSPDGKKLITGCDDGYVRIWDMETFKLIDTLKPAGGINSLAVSNDNQNIIVNYNGKYNQVYLNKYNMTTKNLLYEYNSNISGLGRETIKSIDYNSKQPLFATGGYSLAIFKADLISSIEGNNPDNETSIYPNPATNKANLKIVLPENGVYKLSFTDLNGNELRIIRNEYSDSGEKTFEIDCSRLSTGAYFIKISSTTFSKSFKLVKVQ